MPTPMPSDARLSRRAVTGGLLALGVAALALPRGARALTNDQATTLVTKVVTEINRVIASGGSTQSMISDFERIFANYADVDIIARSCLGPDARGLSAGQMAAYTRAFQGYIARKYGKRFREFIGGRIEVGGVRPVKSWVEVVSTAYLRGQSPFEVKFLVSDKGGRPLFFDMFIEGISMRLSERTEIGAMLDRNRGSIDGLIADLQKAG
ncbi:MlaC/ttg2D family ABC transporter substrate-binding protein [Pseudooceanicola aestuarii]|uniref:MlaC/ttg2D family ABC transporter substrate-binding protein n=1 Tax=Pseudooceanicola aestuarii TaxID=2697319 RepID=UPI0013D02FE2